MGENYKSKRNYHEHREQLIEDHKDWRSFEKESGSRFFMIYRHFKDEHLKNISGGALKLYVYIGLQADIVDGECMNSIDTMAEYFGVDSRTVKNWITELENLKLIYRLQTGYKKVSHTYLLPYGERPNFNIKMKNGLRKLHEN